MERLEVANTLITLSMLANSGCTVGIDLGFNACGVLKWTDPKTFEERISFTFGDYAKMRAVRPRDDYALSYDMDAACFRDQRVVELSKGLRERTIVSIQKDLAAALRELIPSGAAGVSDSYKLGAA